MSKQETEFTDAVEEFVDASPWIGPQHAPAVAALRAMGRMLDKGPLQAAMVGQYGLAFRALAKERPAETKKDPLEEALEAAGAGEG